MQDLWKRRVGISQNGIVYKELVTRPMGPTRPIACQVAVAAFMTVPCAPQSKTSRRCPSKDPGRQVTDAQGATVIACCGCGCPATFPTLTRLSRSTRPVPAWRWRLWVLPHDFFKEAVLAMKNGRPLPEAGNIPGCASLSVR